MSVFPGSIGGRADGASGSTGGSAGGRADAARAPEWLSELTRQIDRFVGASAGEARAAAAGVRRTFSGERLEQALAALRARWKRDGVVNTAEMERSLRIQVREFGLERTIEEWTRHTIGPPSIRV